MPDRRSHDSLELTAEDRELVLRRLQDVESDLQAQLREVKSDVSELKDEYVRHLESHVAKRSSWPRTNDIIIRAKGVMVSGRAPWLLLILLLVVAAGIVWRRFGAPMP